MAWKTRIAAIWSILTILVAGRSMAAPTSQPERESVPPITVEDQKVEDLLDHRLPAVNLPGLQLSDAIDFIRDLTGANIYVDWKTIELAGVTKSARVDINETDIPIRQAFKKILRATGSTALEIQVIRGTVVASTKLNFEDRRTRQGPYLAELSDPMLSAAVLNTRLPQIILTPGTNGTVNDAYQLLQDLAGVRIVMKWGPLVGAGVDRNTPVSLDIRNSRLSDVLYFLLDQAGDGKLGYVIQPAERANDRGVLKKTATVIISTIDDLEANKTQSTTQPN
jgi:hypothetical protein